jgi:hypothetical protein
MRGRRRVIKTFASADRFASARNPKRLRRAVAEALAGQGPITPRYRRSIRLHPGAPGFGFPWPRVKERQLLCAFDAVGQAPAGPETAANPNP